MTKPTKNLIIGAMIKVNKIDIQLTGLSILEVQGYYDLTTADSNDYEWSPSDGGIQIYPELEAVDIMYGNVYVLQVIKSHVFKVSTHGGQNFVFESTTPIRDSKSLLHTYNKDYQIKDSRFVTFAGFSETDFLYRDSPFIELKRWFETVEYHIDFETIYFYRKSNEPFTTVEVTGEMVPIFNLGWSLHAVAHNFNKKWNLQSSKFGVNYSMNSKVNTDHFSYTFQEISNMLWIKDAIGDFRASIYRDPLNKV